MPLVRISVRDDLDPAQRRALADAVHQAMVDTIDVPADDRFQVIDLYPADRMIVDPQFLGLDRSPEAAFVQIALRHGRTDEQKRALYARIAQLAENAGHRPQDILVTLVENTLVDWSFGNGIAHYAPAPELAPEPVS